MIWLGMLGLLASLLLTVRYIHYRGYVRDAIGRRSNIRRSSYGFIYFYSHKYIWRIVPVVKIGRASKTIPRLKSQRTPAPFGLKIFAVVMVRDEILAENLIHRRFRLERIYDDRRNEWFWFSPRLYLYMLTVRDYRQTKKVKENL